jgi:outer membrane protein OmpA-like peptidoglycan-associated protein
MLENQSSYSRWTWIIALVLSLILLLLLLTGHGPTDACCSNGSDTALVNNDRAAPSAIVTPTSDNFSFNATANEFTNEGDGSTVSWFSKADKIKSILAGGPDWTIRGGDKTVTLTGTADTELIKQQITEETQAFFGANVEVNNQMVVSVKDTKATLSPPDVAKLYFEVGKADLPSDNTSTLMTTISWLKAHNSTKAVISGYHDATGDFEKNQALAKARAQKVYDTLVAAGIDTARIEMRKPQVTTGSGNLAEARRVEVSIE